jgi:hypothetical protein
MDENIWIRYRGDDEDLTARSRTPGPGFTATAAARYKILRIIIFLFFKGGTFGGFLKHFKYSSTLLQIPLCRRVLGLNPETEFLNWIPDIDSI